LVGRIEPRMSAGRLHLSRPSYRSKNSQTDRADMTWH